MGGEGRLSKLTQVDRRGGGGKEELKNCLTSFVNAPIHTPILGKTQSIRKIYIYIILCSIACCHNKSWLNLTAFKNSCELCSQTFSRAFLKVVKIERVGVIIFKETL